MPASQRCPRHAVAALYGIAGAHVGWADSKSLSQRERRTLELAKERSRHSLPMLMLFPAAAGSQ